MPKSKQLVRREAHGDGEKERFLLRLPSALMEVVRAHAEAVGRPVSTEIQFALEAYYSEHPQTAAVRRHFG